MPCATELGDEVKLQWRHILFESKRACVGVGGRGRARERERECLGERALMKYGTLRARKKIQTRGWVREH